MITDRTSLNRRSFLKKSASAAFGFTLLPAYLTSARAADNPLLPPSRRINLGCIGVGGRAVQVIPNLCNSGKAIPIALVDVDFGGSRNVEKNLEKYPGARQFNDFRVMLDEMGGDIDAVSVVTPDHTHFTAAIAAMSLGKHVYVEKPLAHTFEEAEILMRAEKKFKVVTQMGNQGHTSSGSAQFEQMLAQGVVDDVVRIEAWKSPSLWFMEKAKRIAEYPLGETIPESMKTWDLWCGPRKKKPFHHLYHPFNWRAFHLYGGGMFGDWGAHIIDFAHDYLKLGLPTKISPLELTDYNQTIFPLASHIRFQFPKRGRKRPAVTLDWKAGGSYQPTIDEKYGDTQKDARTTIPDPGAAGTLLHRKQGNYLIQRGSHGGSSRLYPRVKMYDFKEALRAPKPKFAHGESFVEACMGNGDTKSPFSVGGELTQVLNIGMIAEYLNEELRFNPKKKEFVRNEKANDLLKGAAPRAEWAPYYKLA